MKYYKIIACVIPFCCNSLSHAGETEGGPTVGVTVPIIVASTCIACTVCIAICLCILRKTLTKTPKFQSGLQTEMYSDDREQDVSTTQSNLLVKRSQLLDRLVDANPEAEHRELLSPCKHRQSSILMSRSLPLSPCKHRQSSILMSRSLPLSPEAQSGAAVEDREQESDLGLSKPGEEISFKQAYITITKSMTLDRQINASPEADRGQESGNKRAFWWSY